MGVAAEAIMSSVPLTSVVATVGFTPWTPKPCAFQLPTKLWPGLVLQMKFYQPEASILNHSLP